MSFYPGRPVGQPVQPQWPLTNTQFDNLRQSQGLIPPQPKKITTKIYLPENEIRRSTIESNFNLDQITQKVQFYITGQNKNIDLYWMDEQDEWIRFDTEEELREALTYAETAKIFKIKGKVSGANKQAKKASPIKQPVQQPVVQPPVQQPVVPQPVFRQSPQPVVQQPTVQPPVQPSQSVGIPQQQVVQPQPTQQIQPQPVFKQPFVTPYQPPMQFQPPMQTYQQQQQQQSPFVQPQVVPFVAKQPVGQIPTSFGTPFQPKSVLSNSVTMSNPHPLNQSPQPTLQHSQTQPPINPDLVTYASQLEELRNMGFVDVQTNIALLKKFNGDLNQTTDYILNQ